MFSSPRTHSVPSPHPKPLSLLNRPTPTSTVPRDLVPRRAKAGVSIQIGTLVTDSRRQTRVHHDNSHAIHNTSEFDAPIHGFVLSARNRGDLNAFAQQNASLDSGPSSLQDHTPPLIPVPSHVNRANRNADKEIRERVQMLPDSNDSSSAPAALGRAGTIVERDRLRLERDRLRLERDRLRLERDRLRLELHRHEQHRRTYERDLRRPASRRTRPRVRRKGPRPRRRGSMPRPRRPMS